MDESLEWLMSGRVLYARRSGKESLANLAAFIEQLKERIEEKHAVDVIWHMHDLDVDGVDRRAAMTYLNSIMKHPNVRWFVVVDSHLRGVRRLIATIILRLAGIHWRVVDSQDQALSFLQRVNMS